MTQKERLPQRYAEMDPSELSRQIADRKAELGNRLYILGHHYQCDEILAHADFVGDSLKLSQMAAKQRKAQYIAFCGVHFMAESAAILSSPGQNVILPNMQAGCPMAAMAGGTDVQAAMEEITALTDEKIIPITYVNSTATAKAVTGSFGGACCTSSNAQDVFCWALDPLGGGAKKILMVPDQHLGRNTAFALGYSDDACALYDPALPDGGLRAEDVQRAVFLLWKGHCYVHQQFTAEHVKAVRQQHKDVTVIVHPECASEVVAAADMSGSTEQIMRAVSEAKPGSRWAIGTENHLVNRLAKQYPDRAISCLSPARPVCVQMQQIDLPHLLWVLDRLVNNHPINIVAVAKTLTNDAWLALRLMLDITPDKGDAHSAVAAATPSRIG